MADLGGGDPMFALTPYRVWRELLRENEVDAEFRPRLRQILIASALFAPMRFLEKAIYGRRVRRTKIDKPPVYIMGYGRSGTTHLHNVMARDPQFGYVSTFHAVAQSFALVGSGLLKRLMARNVPKTRPMDNVAVDLDAPQEEAVALALSTRHAYLHYLSFPNSLRESYRRYVLFEDATGEQKERWVDAYLQILRKATYACEGRQLLLKSPVNSGRVPELLELFPDAKMVHIHRNPYEVFCSIEHLFRKVLPAQTLQRIHWDRVEDDFVTLYAVMLQKLIRDTEHLPADRYMEMSFQDLEADPLGQLERIYDTLELPGFAAARPRFRSYLDSLRGYEKNRYDVEPRVIERVNRDWGFALDRWGYPRRSV